MKSRRQALKLCFDSAVVLIVEVINKLGLEVLNGLKFLQVEQLAFEMPKEEMYYYLNAAEGGFRKGIYAKLLQLCV